MTPDERVEIEEWMEIVGKSIERVKREFDNFRATVSKMKIDHKDTGKIGEGESDKGRYSGRGA